MDHDAIDRKVVGSASDTEREKLARALYETDAGTNGYPPNHLSIPWAELTWRDTYYNRADAILRLLAKVPS